MDFADGRFGRTPVTEPHGCAGRSQGPASAREALRWRVVDYHRHVLPRQRSSLNQHPTTATLSALPPLIPLVLTRPPAQIPLPDSSTSPVASIVSTSASPMDARAMRQVLTQLMPAGGGVLDRLGDARERARETLVVLGRFAFRCGGARALLNKRPAGAAAGAAVRTSSPEPLPPASPPAFLLFPNTPRPPVTTTIPTYDMRGACRVVASEAPHAEGLYADATEDEYESAQRFCARYPREPPRPLPSFAIVEMRHSSVHLFSLNDHLPSSLASSWDTTLA
ncbi:hypothetical protein VTO73DRAFT_13151 [Trametes versicolor]